ncbi:MAG: ParB N-terminal domain-containing protein [Phenylobacterium sp.]|uniref:ParB/RepB/Spo0J family partition protein n=1 Tax=Phenylobacterium sp. TaxID=1871053 RepID=UPI001804C528|nr:ParB/RepB/Spo0J family partition protein [Phenylobacterium sp.]MBA4792307.1 ParB N-terminal domain-containing protein [Phenylobacterium sp.]
MASAAPVDLPISMISVGPRLRPVDPAAVQNLQVAIQETVFFGSILVRPIAGEEGEQRYELVAGAHRLAAMRGLGRATIPATIRPLSDDEARQIEIDENLVRRGLTPLERAEMLEARFAVWSRRFPDRISVEEGTLQRKRGRPKKEVNITQFTGGAPQTMGFAVDTAGEVGLSESTVKRAWATINGLSPELRARIHGTWIAKAEGVLWGLAGLGDPALQAAALEPLLAGQTKNVSAAVAIAAGKPPPAAKAKARDIPGEFEKLWKVATPSQRRAVLDRLAGLSLPKGWAVIPTDAPEYGAYQARVAPKAVEEVETDLLGGDDA